VSGNGFPHFEVAFNVQNDFPAFLLKKGNNQRFSQTPHFQENVFAIQMQS